MVLDVNGVRLDADVHRPDRRARDYFTMLKGTTSGASTPMSARPSGRPQPSRREKCDDAAGRESHHYRQDRRRCGGRDRTTNLDLRHGRNRRRLQRRVDTTRLLAEDSVVVATTGTIRSIALRGCRHRCAGRIEIAASPHGLISVPSTGGWRLGTGHGHALLTAGSHVVGSCSTRGPRERRGRQLRSPACS